MGVSLCLMVSHPCPLRVSGALVFAGALGTRVTKCLGSSLRYSFEYLGTITVKRLTCVSSELVDKITNLTGKTMSSHLPPLTTIEVLLPEGG